MWAEILERHLDDRRKNDYHRSDIGKFYFVAVFNSKVNLTFITDIFLYCA